MSRPGFTSVTQTATRSLTKRSLLATAAVLQTLARIGLALIFLVAGAYAQTYSAVYGFSTETNSDTSRWSYRYNTTGTRDGNYTLLPYNEPGISTWYDWGEPIQLPTWFSEPSNAACPCIGANKLARPLISNFGFGPIIGPAQSILEHPSVTSDVGDTVLSFLVPKTGTVTVTYSFTSIDPYGSTGIDWYIDLNTGLGGDLYSGRVRSTRGHIGNTGKQSFQVAVSQGDRLNFIISSDGNYDNDSTALRAIITY
jgi:hypothetical protein